MRTNGAHLSCALGELGRLAAERAAALDAGDVTGMGGMENSMSPRPEPQSQYHASAASKRGFCQQGR